MQNSGTRRIITFIFIAMVVLTAAMTISTFIHNDIITKQRFTIPDDVELVQKETLEGNISDDAPVAVISTSLGDMAAELYPQFAPDTVANFTELAESGYYDGTYIYEVEKGIHFGGGSKYSDKPFSEDYDKEREMVGPEITKNLWPFKGALLSCGLTHPTIWRGQETFSGSRFMACGSINYTDDEKKLFSESGDKSGVNDMFLKYGGTPNVSQLITVFAQIFDGWDTLDAVLNAETMEKTQLPVSSIEITKVSVMSYGEYKEYTENTES